MDRDALSADHGWLGRDLGDSRPHVRCVGSPAAVPAAGALSPAVAGTGDHGRGLEPWELLPAEAPGSGWTEPRGPRVRGSSAPCRGCGRLPPSSARDCGRRLGGRASVTHSRGLPWHTRRPHGPGAHACTHPSCHTCARGAGDVPSTVLGPRGPCGHTAVARSPALGSSRPPGVSVRDAERSRVQQLRKRTGRLHVWPAIREGFLGEVCGCGVTRRSEQRRQG